MATDKIERRDEQFETAGLYETNKTVIRVHSLAVAIGMISLQLERAYTYVVHLTPDEADQLAEMLRLSARGLRGEGSDRPKLGDTLPKTAEDWQKLYLEEQRRKSSLRDALNSILDMTQCGYEDWKVAEVIQKALNGVNQS